MKKFIVCVLCALIAVGSIVPCFATETQAAAIDNTGKVELETGTVLPDVGTSAVSPGSSTLTPSVTNNYLLNGATVGLENGTTVGLEDGTEVNLSDESIDALAEAIVEKQVAATASTYTYAYQYTITTDSGLSIIFDTNEADLLNDAQIYVLETTAASGNIVDISKDGFVFEVTDSAYSVSNACRLYANKTPPIVSFDTLSSLTYKTYTSRASYSSLLGNTVLQYITYSNFDIYEMDGVTKFYPPDVIDVFFNTGFDGLSYESQEWTENFSPGTLTYNGYTFDGWYLDADYTTPYSSDFVPTADFTLYAKWIENGPMDGFHNSLFGALEALFACEPIRYILALCILVIIVGLFKSRRSL